MKTAASAPDDDADFDEEMGDMLDKLQPVQNPARENTGTARERELQAREQEVARRESELEAAPIHRSVFASTRAGAGRGVSSIGPRWRKAARSIGIAFFLIGAILLLYVFRQTLIGFENFSRPDYLSMRIRMVQGDGWGEAILAPIIVIGTEFLKLCYLLALGFLGSIVMAKGIQFFAASESVIDEALENEL